MPIGTGTISLKNNIGPEVGDTGSVSLVNCSNLANPSVGSLPTSMRDFAGHTQGGVPPTAPSNAVVDSTGLGDVMSLTWTQNSNNESGFRLERRLNGGSWQFVTNLGVNVTSTTDSSFGAGSYQFRIRAYNSYGNSSWANSNVELIPVAQQQQFSQQQQQQQQQASQQQAVIDPGCVAIDTEVIMGDGSTKTIGELEIGDEVQSIHIPGLTEEYRGWRGGLQNATISKAKVIFKDMYNEERYLVINQKLKMTPASEYVLTRKPRAKKWKFATADKLSIGDLLLDHNLQEVVIETIEKRKEGIDVAHINVESDDLFFGNGIVIHNIETELKLQ